MATAEVAKKSNRNRGSKPGERRGGRQKGTPNKTTKALKEMILGALSDVGGQQYLAKQAENSPRAFLSLLGRVLPTEVTGGDGTPLTVVVKYEDS